MVAHSTKKDATLKHLLAKATSKKLELLKHMASAEHSTPTTSGAITEQEEALALVTPLFMEELIGDTAALREEAATYIKDKNKNVVELGQCSSC
ncbi:hypothetical protein NDU88_002234 [Pleurodeles waltl]|uniref:Uncharacterized protein n=1 Tax=Pleurodeles waltl TaxID=8319 RepID=A0AAV7SCC5_PLEWA|nr:hypothetical protein NDU88_002234 [Pleurodeles waltl]